MSEDAPPKQYLLMADELHMALLSKIIPGFMFVQVEGINLTDNATHRALVTPILPIPEPQVEQPPEA